MSSYASPEAEKGEAAGTTGYNGVGKSMTSKATLGTSCFSEGSAMSCGNAAFTSEPGSGPDLDTMGVENTPSNGVTSGHV